MKKTPLISLALVAVACVVCWTGCGSSAPSKPKKGPAFSYTLKLDSSITTENGPIKVDVLMINPSTKSTFESLPINKYFLPDSPYRRSAPAIKQFDLIPGQTVTIDLDETNLQYVRYPGYTHVAVLVDSPCADCEEKKEGDPRRKFLPLDPQSWESVRWRDKRRQINITVTKSLGILCDPGWIEAGK